MLTLEKITKGFGPQTVLKEVSLVLGDRERVGIVGVNGAGKSTLVKIMSGQIDPDKGRVDTHRATVGYLSQESQCRLGVTINEEMRSALPGVADVEARLMRASHAVAEDGGSKADLAELAKAADDLQRLEAHTVDARIGRVLSGLGFDLDAVDRLTDTYSGGWQMRIAMAKLLLQEPAYLLLDEPTNHLDESARWWLIAYIQEYPGTVVIISHEPDFLNLTCDKIIEVADQNITEYKGNHEDYERLKQEAYERQLKEWEAQQKDLADTREFIARFKGNKSKSGVVESRERMIAKLDLVEKPRAKARSIFLEFPEAPRSAVEPVVLRHVSKRYGDKVIWDDISLTVVRGDKIALVGPNGIGKSTLLKMIVGDERPSSGEIMVNQKTVVGYFAQHQAEALNAHMTVIEETMAGIDPKQIELARNLLARLQFKGEDAPFKKVGNLSGGERSRVALAKFLLRPANLYLLDEPTNHLDPASRAVIQEALVKFDGTILMASHDRALIDAAANGEYEVENGKLVLVRDPAAARDHE